MQGAEVPEGWSVDQLWPRIGSENLRLSSRGSVFLILTQEDDITRFNSWSWYEIKVIPDSCPGRWYYEICFLAPFCVYEKVLDVQKWTLSIPFSSPSEFNFAAFTERLIIQPSPIFTHSPSIAKKTPRANISTLTCRSRSSIKALVLVPAPHIRIRPANHQTLKMDAAIYLHHQIPILISLVPSQRLLATRTADKNLKFC